MLHPLQASQSPVDGSDNNTLHHEEQVKPQAFKNAWRSICDLLKGMSPFSVITQITDLDYIECLSCGLCIGKAAETSSIASQAETGTTQVEARHGSTSSNSSGLSPRSLSPIRSIGEQAAGDSIMGFNFIGGQFERDQERY
jgi:hypothetical protein